MNDFTFSDNLTYLPPEQPVCYIVPEVQWNELENNLGNASITKDAALWCISGICGGGAITCIVSYFAYPQTQTADVIQIVKQYSFLGIGILIMIACIVIFLFAWKQTSSATAEIVKNQMNVLKKGFRKLTSEKVTQGSSNGPDEVEQASSNSTEHLIIPGHYLK